MRMLMFVLMVVSASAFMRMVVFVLVVVPASAFMRMVVFMLVVVPASAFMLMVVFVPMVVIASAFMLMVVFVLMVVSASAFMRMVMFVLVVMTASALVTMFMMSMAVGMRPVALVAVSGNDHHFGFNGLGNLRQFRNQCIRIIRGEPQLLGRKGNGCLLDAGMGVEFGFHLGSAVGAAKILHDVDLFLIPGGGVLTVPGDDLHMVFHRPGDLQQLRNQGIGIFCGDTQLLGGEGNHSLLHIRMGIEFGFDFGGAVGTVQIFYEIHFPDHRASS